MIPKDRLLSVKEVRNAELQKKTPFEMGIRTVSILLVVSILILGWVVIIL